MTEYCLWHGGEGSVTAPLAGTVHYSLLIPWRKGPSRAAGARRCTRLGCWVLSDFLSSGVWAHLRHWQGRGLGGLQEGSGAGIRKDDLLGKFDCEEERVVLGNGWQLRFWEDSQGAMPCSFHWVSVTWCPGWVLDYTGGR